MPWARRLQIAAVIGLVVTYSVLSHYSNSHVEDLGLATSLALAPMLAFGFGLIWRVRGAVIACVLSVAAALLLYIAWPELTARFALLYLVQQAGFYFLMALTFGLTLRRGAIPLCTRLADKIHGPLSAAELRYTRQVTTAWTLFFGVNVVAAGVMFAVAPIRVWSLFVNFCAVPLVALMFLVEYAVRRRVLPRVEQRSSLKETLRVFFVSPP
jgi:uncharacterized membrane protein